MTIQSLLKTKAVSKTKSNSGYPGKSITESIINGFITVDRNWTVKYWNKAAEKLLGVPAEDVMGKNLWEKFAGSIPLEFYEVYHKIFLQDNPVHFEEYWGEMGSWFDVITYNCDNTVSISFKSSNQSVNLEFPKNLQNQLQITNELYRFVTEVTNDCLWEWDLQTREIFWIDGGHKRIFGYPVENTLIPQSFWESCLHPDDKVRLLARLQKNIIAGSVSWEDEYRFKKSDGNYAYVHDRGHIMYNQGKQAIRMIGATRDITARKSIEIQLLESERKLAKERLARQKELINAVLTAHESERLGIGKELHDNINQILGATLLYIELAKTEDENKDLFLEKSSSYISIVIEEIRKISKTLIIPDKDLDLVDSIKNLLDDLKVIHPIKIEFHAEGISEEYLDAKLQLNVFRIVQEQLTNVLKHAKATHATINLTRHDNDIILLISDNGEGFDVLKDKKGVGLVNITNRAELYHGKVKIESKPGEGVQLKVVLPYPKTLRRTHMATQ